MSRIRWEWLLTVLTGFGLGLFYAWAVSPTRYVDTTPNTLRADFKDAFRTSIAASYAATHDLERARARLALLGDPDPIQALTAEAQRMLAAGEPFATVQEVASLATDMQNGVASSPVSTSLAPVSSPGTPSQISTLSTSAATSTPQLPGTTPALEASTPTVIFDTPTPRPTRTPIPTASAPFQLVNQEEVCKPNLTDGLLQISILDSHRHQMPGVEITISSDAGEESFFTGLKPEIGDGYADYVMQAGAVYSLRVARTGNPVTGLTAPACPDSNGQTYTGGLKLTFQQP
jgi:hypothetical protein